MVRVLNGGEVLEASVGVSVHLNMKEAAVAQIPTGATTRLVEDPAQVKTPTYLILQE
jgi:hypothetical protein